MDTHIAREPTLDGVAALRARLPGEPEPDLSDAPAEPPQRAGPRPTAAPKIKRRTGLLSGVAIIAVVVAGVGFLVSRYNKVVPVPPAVKLAALQAEAQVALLWHERTAGMAKPAAEGQIKTAAVAVSTPQAPAPPPATVALAPSAALATVHPPAPPSAVVQPAYKPQPQTAEMAELLQLKPGASSGSATAPTAPPAHAAGQHRESAVHAPAAPHPPAPPPHPPALPPLASLQAAVPPGYVPHEPGAVAVPLTAPAAQPAPVAEAASTGSAQRIAAPSAAQRLAPSGGGAAGSPGTSKPATQPGTPAQSVAMAAPHGVAVAASATAKVIPPTAASPSAQAATVTASDALAVSHDLQAAPMSSDQQIQVLELVTQLATLIRDEHTQIADLRADVRTTNKGTAAKLVDFERRLDLVEAGTALAAASGSTAAAAAPSPTTATGPAPSAVPVALTSAQLALASASQPQVVRSTPPPALSAGPATSVPAAPVQYRVRAASPGLAMLAEVDRGGGDGAQREVQVGDTLPGYGRVLSVAQQGTAWVVTTEHGNIQ